MPITPDKSPKKRKFAHVVAGLGVVFLIGTPIAAQASQGANWYSASNPLTAWNDSTAQAQGYGITYIGEDVKAWNHSWYRDAAPGGNKTYEQTDYAYHEPETSGAPYWHTPGSSDQTVRTNNYPWSNQYNSDDPADHPQADLVRIFFKVCEDRPWSPDLCSRDPYHTKSL